MNLTRSWLSRRLPWWGLPALLFFAWTVKGRAEEFVPIPPNGVEAGGGTCPSLGSPGDQPVIAWGTTEYNVLDVPAGLTNVVAIASGGWHNLALRDDGTIMTWGDRSREQVRIESVTNATAISDGSYSSLALTADGAVVDLAQTWPVPPKIRNVVCLAAGRSHNLALKADGTVAAWGGGYYGATNVPRRLTNVVAIAAGADHSLALKADGTVVAWGAGRTNTGIWPQHGQSMIPSGLSNVVGIAAGSYHTLALKADGTAVAWGLNNYGQADVPQGLTNVTALAAGNAHSLALKADGTIVAWGSTDLDQTNVPQGLSNVVAITAGWDHSVALVGRGPPHLTTPLMSRTADIDSTVQFRIEAAGAWPLSFQWRLNGTNLPGATNPVLRLENAQITDEGWYSVAVSNAAGVVVSAGASLTVGEPLVTVVPAGQVALVGQTVTFEASTRSAVPLWFQWRFNGTPLPGATNAILTLTNVQVDQEGYYSVAASNAFGGLISSEVRLMVGSVFAWGDNLHGQIAVPSGLSNVVAIAAGGQHSLVLLADGTVRGWGAGMTNRGTYPDYGQAGNRPDLTNLIAVSAGWCHSLGLTAEGTVVAWGAIGNGEGNAPPGLSNVVAISAGMSHSLALRQDGTVFAWGNNGFGQTNIPPGLDRVVAIAGAGNHTLALKEDGTVVAWGDNQFGASNVPSDLHDVVAVAGAGSFSLALKEDGTVVGWGMNNVGQTNVPSGLTNVSAIAAGTVFSLALRTDGTVAGWGGNFLGQLNMPAGLTNVIALSGGGAHALALVGTGLPAITVQPVNRTFIAETDLMLKVMAVGVPPLRYQWQLNGSDLPGATNASLRFVSAGSSDAGSYQVVVSNALGRTVSRPAILTLLVDEPPSIVVPPTHRDTYPGGSAGFQVVAQGAKPLSYQWLRDGIALADATNDVLALQDVTTQDAGVYSVVVSNAYGAETSAPANLTVTPRIVVAWGDNWYGQSTVPPGLTNVVALAAWGTHNVALKGDGTVATWGYDLPWETNAVHFQDVSASLANVVAISARGGRYYALRDDGTVVAWGLYVRDPLVAPDWTNVVAIAAGDCFTLALREDGTVSAWGSQPVVSDGLSNIVAVAAGYAHGLALRVDGTVSAWGWNDCGQADVPRGLSNVVALAAGDHHSLALLNNGTVVAWGCYQGGMPSDLTNVVAIAAGRDFSLALKADGSVAAWGNNASGQLEVPSDLTHAMAIAGGSTHSLALVGSSAPLLTVQPPSRDVIAGTTATLVAMAAGSGPLYYQWQRDGINLPDATQPILVLPDLQPEQTGQYTVIVSNINGVVTSRLAQVTVLVPPGLAPQPASMSAMVGSNITFTIDATGTPPLYYQWRKNGVNILGAANSWFTITNVQVNDGGSYSVVVANLAGAATSDPTLLLVEVPVVPPGDDFASRVMISGLTNSIGGTNRWATREPTEPYHAAKFGSNSVWYTWTAPLSGIATFRTVGSTFDTLLGVYTNNLALNPEPSLLNLVTVESDEDRGGYLTSELGFNAAQGVDYQVAIDGLAGQQGTFILSWELEPTTDLIPVITSHPTSQAVLPGGQATFSVAAMGSGLTYQWYLNGAALAGATGSSYTRAQAGETDLGSYTVRVRNAYGRETKSLSAGLEIAPMPRRVAVDKLEDLFKDGGPGDSRLKGQSLNAAGLTSGTGGVISVAMGMVDYQLGNNVGAQSEAWEPNHGGVLGGSSKWYELRTESAGTLVIDTIGSSFDTVLAVYRRTNLVNLVANEVVSDNDGSPDGVRSRVRFETVAGAAYWVVVDGVGGAEGIIHLNWALGRAPEVTTVWTNTVVAQGTEVMLEVSVANAIPPAWCQWHRNGEPVPGATDWTLRLTNVEPSQEGYYSAVVSNAIATVIVWAGIVQLESASVSLVRNRFVTDDESWLLGTSDYGPATPGSGWQAGGFLEVRASSAKENWWLRAPRQYVGNQSAMYGGWLQFDLRQTGESTNPPVVRLEGTSVTLLYRCENHAGQDWTTNRLSLREEAGWLRLDGSPALRGDLMLVLSNLIGLQIEGQFDTAIDACALDNVELLAPCTDDPPPLRIQWQADPPGAVLMWPAQAGCYELEGAPDLQATAWMINLAAEPLGMTNGWQRVLVAPSSGLRFFRLHRP